MIDKPRKVDRLISREVDEELVVVDPRDGEAFLLNEVGAAILDLCDGQMTVDEITAEVVSVLNADAAEVSAQVRAFVEELESKGLLEEGE